LFTHFCANCLQQNINTFTLTKVADTDLATVHHSWILRFLVSYNPMAFTQWLKLQT